MNKLGQSIHFDRNLSFDGTDLVEEILLVRVREIDEFIIKSLYETYKNDKKISQVLVISTEEFGKFLKKYLPIYMKEATK